MALSLLNLLDKGEIDSEEVTYPIAPNVFIGVKMALSVILVEGVDRPNTTHKCDTDSAYYQDVRKSEVSASGLRRNYAAQKKDGKATTF